MRRVIGRLLHGHGFVQGRVEGLACRVEHRQTGAFEGLFEKAQRRLLAR